MIKMKKERRNVVALVGVKQAREGFAFVHGRPSKKCGGCKLFKVCVETLEPDRVYEVVLVRGKTFPCRIHEGGVQVVEVVEKDVEACIDARFAMLGAAIAFQPQDCDNVSCENYIRCVPEGIGKGDRCKILDVKGRVTCSRGSSLVLSFLRRLPD